MSDELLPYYDRELAYLRRVGAQFAKAHPKIAGRLRLGADAVEDPHVSRLIESVAFLNARIRKKLDDDLPEMTDALLSVLAPHQLAPIPSMSVVQFSCDADLTTHYDVPKGAALESDRIYGHPCTFRTSYPTRVWPLNIAEARLRGTPFQAPRTPWTGQAAAVIHLKLVTTKGQCPIADLDPRELRFFLKGQPGQLHELYELILRHTKGVAVASSATDPAPWTARGDACIRPVGFEPDEAVLATDGRTHPGHRLLTEFFVFPSKFHFFELFGLGADKLAELEDELHLFLFLDQGAPELEVAVGAESFALGCTPIVNLFQRRAEPVELNHRQSEVHILPDARQPTANEVVSIDSVAADSRAGEHVEYRPFYGIEHAFGDGLDEDHGAYWYASRRRPPQAEDSNDARTDVYLSLVDLGFETAAPEDWVLTTRVTCSNGDLPARLPFGGGQPKLHFTEGGGGIQEIQCQVPLTAAVRPAQKRGAMWKLVSQLSLNHLSLVGGTEGTAALQEILRVQDPVRSPENKNVVASLASSSSRAANLRVAFRGQYGFCQGTEVTLVLDEELLRTSGAYLFAAVLDRFLGGYCAINTFVQLVTVFKGRGETLRWKPRAGDRTLL